MKLHSDSFVENCVKSKACNMNQLNGKWQSDSCVEKCEIQKYISYQGAYHSSVQFYVILSSHNLLPASYRMHKNIFILAISCYVYIEPNNSDITEV